MENKIENKIESKINIKLKINKKPGLGSTIILNFFKVTYTVLALGIPINKE